MEPWARSPSFRVPGGAGPGHPWGLSGTDGLSHTGRWPRQELSGPADVVREGPRTSGTAAGGSWDGGWEGGSRGEAGPASRALGRTVFSACAPITPCPQAGPRLMLIDPSICQAWWSPWGTRGSPPSCSCPPAACASPTPAPPGGCSCARRWAPGWASTRPLWVGDEAQAVGEPAWDPSVSSPPPTSLPGFL